MPLAQIRLQWRAIDGAEAAAAQLAAEGTSTRLFMLDWTETPASVDERLSWRLVEVLSATLCDLGRLSFLSDELAPGDGSGLRGVMQRLGAVGAGESAAAAWRGLSEQAHHPIRGLNESVLVSTTSADTARHAFTIGAWHLAAAQVLLVSDAAQPPALPDALVRQCAQDKNWDALAAPLRACGIRAVLTQGHDGACLGVLPLADGIEAALHKALSRNAAIGGIGLLWPSD